jgi:hypothetical protein
MEQRLSVFPPTHSWETLNRQYFLVSSKLADPLLALSDAPFACEVSVQLYALRLLAVAALVLLYEVNSMIGVAALAGTFGYVIAARRYRQTSVCEHDR